MTTYTRRELHDKRAKLIGEIAQLEKRTRELHNKLAYIEASIRILWPGEELPKVVPRGDLQLRHFKRGHLARLVSSSCGITLGSRLRWMILCFTSLETAL